MAVVVFDSDVLIGFMSPTDAHHAESVDWMRRAWQPGTRRWLCVVNLSEILIGPIRAGLEERVDMMLVKFSIETVTVDKAYAERAAAVRARTGLDLPDAYALATAIHGEKRGYENVELATFDKAVRKARAQLQTG